MTQVRTRFAPSPTGSLHVGGVRTALFNYLFAKKQNGVFVLRIEDSDVVRSTQEFERQIVKDLQWLGLEWEEGPDTQGKSGPYRQSERTSLYQAAVRKLEEKALIYPCYCAEEELQEKRKGALARGETPRYDGQCRKLTAREREEREKEGRKPAWRFDIFAFIREDRAVAVDDLVRGKVNFQAGLMGDFIVFKSNQFPSYNFACVVDDHEMEISHVIRGDEHLTNTPRQILLYEALGWNVPRFAHLSMILAPDHTKLSKRHGATAVSEFREKGYLPHAILNYLVLLGWSPKEEREIFLPAKPYSSVEEALKSLLGELAGYFSLDRISKNSAIFDTQKLAWMNAQVLRILSPDNLVPVVSGFLASRRRNFSLPEEAVKSILQTQKNDFQTLEDCAKLIEEFFLPGEVQVEENAKEVFAWPWFSSVIQLFEKKIQGVEKLTPENFSSLMKEVQVESGKKGKELYWPIRVGVTGKTHGPELFHLLPFLGKQEILLRLDKTKLRISR